MKRTARRTSLVIGLAGGLAALGIGTSYAKRPPLPPSPPEQQLVNRQQNRIQIALLLDTSGSMQGLIDQAKSQLWRIVNEFGAAKRGNARARLEIALYEYGKSSIPAEQGYIRQIVPFTTDLDRVSEELFGLGTNGGEEYAGLVIQEAMQGLEWSGRPSDMKLIFIAGNESFFQGAVDPLAAIGAAGQRGVTVSTIYCGSAGNGEASGWRRGADLARGSFMVIDHNSRVAVIAAPQDEEIARLGVQLNETYLPYGAMGEAGRMRQAKEDANAATVAQGAPAQRALAKASASYDNRTWDLVDAVRGGRADVAKLDAASLPPAMRNLSAAERKGYLEAKAAERARIQKRIAELDAQRRSYVAAEQARNAKAGGKNTLDEAVVESAHEVGKRYGYSF